MDDKITVKLKPCEVSRIAFSIYDSDYRKRFNYEAAKFAFSWQVKAARCYKSGLKRKLHIDFMKTIIMNIKNVHMFKVPNYIKSQVIGNLDNVVRKLEMGKL